MSDIFISYASEDRGRVFPLVEALEKTGWTIFWDRNIPAGKTWHQRMGEEIKTCGSVLVVWTEKSVHSDWVLEEAEIGKRKQILVPIMFDEVEPPFGFGLIQAANLVGWNGSSSEPSFRRMISDIETILGPAPAKGTGIESRRTEKELPGRVTEQKPSSTGHGGRPLRGMIVSGATKSYAWFKQEARKLSITLIASIIIIVALHIWLGWDLAPGEISVIVLFVWITVVAIYRLGRRSKRKRAHAKA